MASSARLMNEEPEQSSYRVRRQRTTRITMAVVAVLAVFAMTGVFVSRAYQNGPKAAASPANQASP